MEFDENLIHAAIANFLKSKNYNQTLETFMSENKLNGINTHLEIENDNLISLMTLNTNRNCSSPKEQFECFLNHLSVSLDIYRNEISQFTYPVFIHLFFHYICSGNESKAKAFFIEFSVYIDSINEYELNVISAINSVEHIKRSPMTYRLRNKKYQIFITRESFTKFCSFLKEDNLIYIELILKLHIHIKCINSANFIHPRSYSLYNQDNDNYVKPINCSSLTDQLFSNNSNINNMDSESSNTNNKSNITQSSFMNPVKVIPNSTSSTSHYSPKIPFPELMDFEHKLLESKHRDLQFRQMLISPCQAKQNKKDPVLPSSIYYSVFNSRQKVISACLNDECSLLSLCDYDSSISLFSLNNKKMKSLRPPNELSKIDKGANDIMERILSDKSSSESKTLRGHSGPVFEFSFSPNGLNGISCSEDSTIRLWNLLTYSSVHVFKGHVLPVWTVNYSPKGFYFCSGGEDGVGRVWSTEQPSPLRILPGHFSDINTMKFHPNSNYIASGSSDRVIRLWDMFTANSVRSFSVHKTEVTNLIFSPNGRYLISGDSIGCISINDLQTSKEIYYYEDSILNAAITSLSTSREGNYLISTHSDGSVKLFDLYTMTKSSSENTSSGCSKLESSSNLNTNEISLINKWNVKGRTCALTSLFNRRNVAIIVGRHDLL